jgi:Helicase conserved C-terminal domain
MRNPKRQGPPDVDAVLRGLKDFQRDTVEYVFRRLYVDSPTTRRFLVADEVGLGKTLVARGIIAKTLQHLWEDVPRIDVVYICSNGDIARQNINRLNVTGRADFVLASRITMLPVEVQNLRKQRTNFISLTPGTSLEPRSQMGKWHERALLYWLLRDEWGLKGRSPLNVLVGTAGTDYFRNSVKSFRREHRIDKPLQTAFHDALRTHEKAAKHAEQSSLKDRFHSLCADFQYSRKHIPADQRKSRRELIGELRELLALTCVHALEPDLIILDEFQRFRQILHGSDLASSLARDLFEYGDEHSDARVLLLSATPYKMYTLSGEGDGDDHYADFVSTLRFLFNDESRTNQVETLLGQYRHELFRLGTGAGARLQGIKERLEKSLRSVMVRTERLAVSETRDGMLREMASGATTIAPHEPLTYRAYQEIADIVGHGDTLEYWKSAPYLLNFMDDYLLKRKFEAVIRDPGKRFAATKAVDREGVLLPWKRVDTYEGLDSLGARLRWLMEDTLGRGAWKLLWIPPSLPYYKLEGTFAEPAIARFTKRLVFSAWRLVPKATASLLSYEAERLMIRSYEKDPQNTPEARKGRRPLLVFSLRDGRPAGMPVLGLLYPSIVLARDYDPLDAVRELAQSPRVVTAAQLLGLFERRLKVQLSSLPETTHRGPADESWYWAAPLLLDRAEGDVDTTAWFRRRDLAQLWSPTASEDDEDDSNWADHVERARELVTGRVSLGRKPDDLAHVLALMALAAPGVASLRALGRVSGGESMLKIPELRDAAGRMAWGLRSLFNTPEAIALIRGQDGREPYWQGVLQYCIRGGLQSVLDEFAHGLREQGEAFANDSVAIAEGVSNEASLALSLRTAVLRVDDIGPSASGRTVTFGADQPMRTRFALTFGRQRTDEGSTAIRADQVRKAFNSPFWPFVLVSTSVGQEGLDFHPYCHAVVHWNLPSNPVDLEQREGRVHRYKGHAVRKNVATQHAAAGLGGTEADPWQALFDAAVKERPADATDLVPFWVYPLANGAAIERHIPSLPLSREVEQLAALRRSLVVYRMAFGQPRQDDLIAFLLRTVSPDLLHKYLTTLQIDLTPPPAERDA